MKLLEHIRGRQEHVENMLLLCPHKNLMDARTQRIQTELLFEQEVLDNFEAAVVQYAANFKVLLYAEEA
jgi:hypothetical protein